MCGFALKVPKEFNRKETFSEGAFCLVTGTGRVRLNISLYVWFSVTIYVTFCYLHTVEIATK